MTDRCSRLALADSAADVLAARSVGKTASLMGAEGGHAIENSLAALRTLRRLGVRYMTLTHSSSHSWADSSSDISYHGGLSGFGREVVEEMNRLGMIVDVSHVSDETFWDVIGATRAPVIASHSNCRAIADHPRNLSDEMLRAVAANDGVVMVNFFSCYVDPEKTAEWMVFSGLHWLLHLGDPETPLSLLVDHIDHVVQVAGIDHVGLGSDFDGIPFVPANLRDVSDLPNITVELMRRGYSDEHIRKILGGNVLRVLSDVERVAESADGGP